MVATFSTSSAVAQTLRDASYNYVGKISPNGTVRDSNSHVIGYAQGVPVAHAAVYFFFNFF